jgi:hypothetical protein
MNGKTKVLCLLIVSGLLLGMSPVTRLYRVDAARAGSSGPARAESASIQFILVHVERKTLAELTGGSKAPTLDSISLEKLGRYLHDEDGAEIISQTKLTILDGREAEMAVTENHRHKAKNADEGNTEQSRREVEVSVKIKAKIREGNALFADFAYKRSVAEESFNTGEKAEEEGGGEQKFEVSSGIILTAGQACIAGGNMDEDTAALLIVKADLK